MRDKRVLILTVALTAFLGLLSLAHRSVSSLASFSLATISEAGFDISKVDNRKDFPVKVTGVTANSDICRIVISWNHIPGVRGYRIYRGEAVGEEIIIGGSDSNEFFDEDVECDNRYSYRISAINNRGEGPKSSSARITAER